MINSNHLSLIVGVFILVIVGISLYDTTADSVYLAVNQESLNESITIASSTGVTSLSDVEVVTYFYNDTANSGNTSNAINTAVNYTTSVDAVSTITVDQTIFADGTYRVLYEYYQDEYVKGSAATRTLVDLVLIFFALGIAGLTISVFYIIAKKNNII